MVMNFEPNHNFHLMNYAPEMKIDREFLTEGKFLPLRLTFTAGAFNFFATRCFVSIFTIRQGYGRYLRLQTQVLRSLESLSGYLNF